MIPGEMIVQPGEIELNTGRAVIRLQVANTGDRPIQVGSHFHFYEVNPALEFNREQAYGMRLDIPAGTAVRFEPGDEKEISLVPLAGSRIVYGFNGRINGPIITQNDKVHSLFSFNGPSILAQLHEGHVIHCEIILDLGSHIGFSFIEIAYTG